MTQELQCPSCRGRLDASFLNRGGLSPCPTCLVLIEIEAFPALLRPMPRGSEGEPVMMEGEASCFYHPQKKATVPCQSCGRFLCALCDCQLNEKHFCPSCLETGKQKGKIQHLQNQRTLYGRIALALAIYPVVLFVGIYFTFITAPLALYFALRHWNSPRSIVGGTRIPNVLAVLFAVAELAGWGVMIYFIVKEGSRHA